MLALSAALYGLATALVGWLTHWVVYKQRKWARIRVAATNELESSHPDTTNDPVEAVERALVRDERHRIKRESISISQRMPRPGSVSDSNGAAHKTPHQGIAIARTTSEDREP